MPDHSNSQGGGSQPLIVSAHQLNIIRSIRIAAIQAESHTHTDWLATGEDDDHANYVKAQAYLEGVNAILEQLNV